MANHTLVDADIAIGAAMLLALDQAELSVSVALWFFSDEHEDWRFAFSSRTLDHLEPLAAYRVVHNALSAGGVPVERTPPLMLFKMSDHFIRALRRMYAKSNNNEGKRLGPQSIGDRFVEDAIVYRIR